MTHEARELSLESGEPVELYEFLYTGGNPKFTGAQRDQVLNATTYIATPINHSDIECTGELAKNDITLTVPGNFPVALLFQVAPPSSAVLLTIFEWHVGEDDDEKITLWTGRVLNAEWMNDGTAQLTCENIYTSLRRPGLRRTYSRQCQHVLYRGTPGNGCGLVDTDFMVEATLTVVSGTKITSPTIGLQVADYFPGGFMYFNRVPGVVDYRAIRSQDGNDLVLTHPIEGLVAGSIVKLFAGCDHSTDTCRTKFDNLDNYGGFPNVPKMNPMGGSSPF